MTLASRSAPHVLVLATADWDAPLWTNKQYVALELAREFDVTYVESLGLRRLSATAVDLRRAARRVVRGLVRRSPARGHRPYPARLRVTSPLVVPFHESRAAERLNPLLLRRAVRGWLASPSRLLWTFSPLTYGLNQLAHHTIYHAVDLMHEYPRHYGRAIVAGERQLAAQSCTAIASSEVVRSHLCDVGFHGVDVLGNVADVGLFSASASSARSAGHVLFAGNLSPHKVDFDLLAQVAALPDVLLHIAGPAALDGSSAPQLKRLQATGAILHGPLAPDALARLAGSCAVGLVPYVLNAYTAGVSPMKLFEYLAAGAAVVSTAIPAVVAHASQDVVVAETREQFLAAVATHLAAPGVASIERRQRLASRQSWEQRGPQLRELARGAMSAQASPFRAGVA